MGGVVVVRKRPHGAIKMLNLSTTHSISIPIPPIHQSNNPVRPLRKRLWFVDNRKSKNCWQHDDGDDSVGWLAAMIQPIGMFRRGKGKRGRGHDSGCWTLFTGSPAAFHWQSKNFYGFLSNHVLFIKS